MSWPITIMLGVSLFVFFAFVVLVWNPAAKGWSIDRLPDLVVILLTRSGKGGFRRLDHQQSDVWFSFEKVDENDNSATLALRIPRQERILNVADDLQQSLASNGFDLIVESDNPSLYAKVFIPVPNIWDASCGAKGAHAARILIDTIGLPRDALFDVEIGGARIDPDVRRKLIRG